MSPNQGGRVNGEVTYLQYSSTFVLEYLRIHDRGSVNQRLIGGGMVMLGMIGMWRAGPAAHNIVWNYCPVCVFLLTDALWASVDAGMDAGRVL